MSTLVRDEMRLAQAEMTQKGKKAGLGIGLFSVAGLLAFFGLAVLITTAILALALVLPAWLAALIVTVVLFAGAGVRRPGRQEERPAGHTRQARGGPRRPQAGRRHRQGGAHRMSASNGTHPTTTTPTASNDPDAIRADIEQTRENLAETVDALHAKLDVKTQAKAKAAQVKDSATTDAGKPRPELIGAAVAAVAAGRRAGLAAAPLKLGRHETDGSSSRPQGPPASRERTSREAPAAALPPLRV